MIQRILPALLLLGLLFVGPATAQSPQLVLAFDAELDESLIDVPAGARTEFVIEITDRSSDGGGSVPGAQGVGLPHTYEMEFIAEAKAGWLIQRAGALPETRSGDTAEIRVAFLANVAIKDPYFPVDIVITMRDQAGQTVTNNVTVLAYSAGVDGFNVQAGSAFQVQPGELAETSLKITNNGLYPRTFDMDLGENKCNLLVVPPQAVVVGPKATEEVPITVEGPTDRFWYASESCSVAMMVTPQDNTNIDRTVSISGQVTGGYVEPTIFFWMLAIALAAFILFIFVARRKSRIEEELLGRPQKPWTIPVERVYLEHLKERDPQAHYVVRHFLMEEEYASALLWYSEFKKATKGGRAKERLVIGQEHRVKRLRKKWEKRIARPAKKAANLERRLQKKLDRQGRKGLRERQKKWKKLTKKMQAAHDKKSEKILGKWEKQVKRANKKGIDAPAKPDMAGPDLPAEPTGDKVLLSEHKWNKKAQKAQAKATKKTGNLEVKFEKKEAKLLKDVRKKVSKIAKKLDDPEFEAEHPLLQAAES